ncbi:MAG: site-specific DNA-methyltransferase [Aeromicrobium sp.]
MSATSSESPRDDTALGRAIAKVTDPELRKVLTREVALLKDSRSFGLVFDRHLPETARLPKHAVRAGLTVVRRDDAADVARIVTALDGSTAGLDDGTSVRVDELVVFRDFGDVVHPGLRSVERVERAEADAPWHTVINGENLHVLQLLRQTHGGKVDLIYIDPPYNTGNEGWIYNDKYVDANDRTRSSKWLSFMERRLTIAKSLLKQTGIIIVAIGDEEHHRLRMLMDQVFGASNFISNVVWQGGRKNDSRYVSNGADYMLVYARDVGYLTDRNVRWREGKPGLEIALDNAKRIWQEASGNHSIATKRWRSWMREFKAQGLASDSVTRFTTLDPSGRPIRTDGSIASPNPRPNLMYDLVHPVTGRPVHPPVNGWRYSRQEMDRRIDEGLIVFGPDETRIPSGKTFLDEMDSQVAESVFVRDRNPSGNWLKRVLGAKRFPNPKDHEVLMRWIRLAAPRDAVVLDFFGGSGTTTEAVIRLNAEDGGTRQSILVTNNEIGSKQAKELRKRDVRPGDPEWEALGVFEYVTRPRILTVVTGERPDGSTYSDGLDANVDLMELTYVDPGEARRGREFEAIAPILWMEAGARGSVIDTEPEAGWALAQSYGVLFDVDALKGFADAVTDRAKNADLPGLIFVVTDSPTELRLVIERLPVGCTVRRLYESYVDRFALGVDGESA